MTIVNYRQFAVEIVRDVCKLLNRSGSCQAFRLAQTWANGNAEIGIWPTMPGTLRSVMQGGSWMNPGMAGSRPLRSLAVVGGRHLRHVEEIIAWVAMAKAARYAFERHGTQIGATGRSRIRLPSFNRNRIDAREVGKNRRGVESLHCVRGKLAVHEFGLPHALGHSDSDKRVLKFETEFGTSICTPSKESALRMKPGPAQETLTLTWLLASERTNPTCDLSQSIDAVPDVPTHSYLLEKA